MRCTDHGKIASVSSDLVDRVSSLFDYQTIVNLGLLLSWIEGRIIDLWFRHFFFSSSQQLQFTPLSVGIERRMSVLRNSRTAAVQVRGFATSSSLRVGPESPHFIDVPKIIQPTNPSKPHVRGTLPVPRELFPARRTDKPGQQYLDAATPLPQSERTVSPNSSDPEKQAWKHKMANLRRQNLREGLQDLYSRKKSSERRMVSRSLDNQKRRDRILRQPMREDELLTRPTTVEAMRPRKQPVLPDPNREKRLALSQARLEAKQAEKEAERRDYLQSLYMNARNFITTEEQLAAEIDRVFPEGENEAWRNDHQPGENIWNLGNPPTINGLLNRTRSNESARWDIGQERVKKLAEVITGGKI
ncbi:uncharacterized protein N7515_001594 [Penicillium bovifimosum]|uniref:Uncharacterized protein n=1 Tax=Penicillium bovifimosum TaxID=126998 RepID=A0A9W9H9Z0_9EURO|nr:uncharacterized protein N7515_001594 [Penicillium bovifimosum]KAJ5142807.1 hypothetical protein N7515_001594 [Penicillium bovifimosum]